MVKKGKRREIVSEPDVDSASKTNYQILGEVGLAGTLAAHLSTYAYTRDRRRGAAYARGNIVVRIAASHALGWKGVERQMRQGSSASASTPRLHPLICRYSPGLLSFSLVHFAMSTAELLRASIGSPPASPAINNNVFER
jgi:hypothetical protein